MYNLSISETMALSDRDASVPRAEENEIKDWEREGYPRALWHLYVHEMQVKESPEVINAAVLLLAASGVSQEWQLLEISQDDLERILPQDTHMKEYLATKFVISKLKAKGTNAPDMNMMVEAVLRLGRDIKSSQPKRKKGPFNRDSEDERQDHFNSAGVLEYYGLESVPREHMPRNAFMEKVAKKAQSATKGQKEFLAPGSIIDYWPQWMREAPMSVDQCQTHTRTGAQLGGAAR